MRAALTLLARVLLSAVLVMAALAAPAASTPAAGWRDRIGIAGAAAPAVTTRSPLLALIDTPVDAGNAAFSGGSLSADAALVPYDLHGTATAAVAAATGAGGLLGVWPGMRVRSFPFAQDRASCEAIARLVTRAVAQGAATISMSFGSDAPCFAEQAALQAATRRGVVLVAAAGNDRLGGNPIEYPAADPHVITVSALGQGDAPAAFSSTSSGPDVTAPGTDVLTAVPWAFDPDPITDGIAQLSGTSFSAPMVAAAATWLRAARPALTSGQIGMLLCDAARDIGAPGWDRRTGCGVLDVRAALLHRAPSPDPGEPNDDVQWVDGLDTGAPSPSIWRGARDAVLRAWVTAREDPADVYRIQRPPHSTTRITLTPTAGGADLRVLEPTALDIADRSALLAVSRARGRGTDQVTVTNPAARWRVAYVVVTHDPRAGLHRSRYTLSVRSPARPGRRARSRPR